MGFTRSGECLEALLCFLGASLVVSESLYRLNSYGGQLYVNTQELPLSSATICAATCAIHSCVMFTFQDGICKMHDVGLDNGDYSVALSRTYTIYDPSVTTSSSLNAALMKPCQPQIQYFTYVCGRAFDADLITQFHSLDSLSPWLSVDLQGYYYVKTIIIMPHPAVPEWFVNMTVFVGTQAAMNGYTNQTLIAMYPGPWNGQGSVIFPVSPPVAARFVTLQSTNTLMSILEFKIIV